MEFFNLHKVSHPSIVGEEKQQMLSLNRRLEAYLSRVKLLEEENTLLAKELHSIRHNNQEDWSHRGWMKEELRQARLEVDAAWKDRVLSELEVSKLAEELQNLEKQRQREVQATTTAKTKMEQSKKELEVEQRAQIWLREKVNQMEHELGFLVQTHEENVAHLEESLIQSKTTVPPTFVQRYNRRLDLLQMGDEVYQRTMRAWQETATAYQDQLARLEESFDQTRNRLTEAGKEKVENQLKLQNLEKEIVSAQEVRLHLENTVAQQRDKHYQEIQQIQEYLENLKEEKDELGQQINHLLQENRNLVQLKTSLGLEVATYRALLDAESLRGDRPLSSKPRHISITDAAFHPRVVKKKYQTQFYARYRNTITSPVRAKSTIPFTKREPETLNETLTISTKHSNKEKPYPKIIQDGAIEKFRPKEVCERVTYAEPLSPPNEDETPQEEDEEEKKDVDRFREEKKIEEFEFGLHKEPYSDDEAGRTTTPCLMSHDAGVMDEEVSEKERAHQPAFFRAGLERNDVDQKEMWDSDTDIIPEPNFKSWQNSLEPECDFVESVFNQIPSEDTAQETRREESSPVGDIKGTDFGDTLYPDGEEMDTWDSVIERKVEVKTGDMKETEETKQHAEPEEDISSKEHERAKSQVSQDECAVVEVEIEPQISFEQGELPPPDKDDEDDDEDSQNVSVSWRTELESDSYAQDNTVADTRPLIRYKSDETDANTQASHMDESESSDGEHERKTGEMGTGTWSDGKSKTFGTMEDLCEEVEEEMVDEEYNWRETDPEDKDVYQETTNEQSTDTESGKNMETNSEEEHEERWRQMGRPHVELEEELEIDRLVEQELENLSTDSYSAHFFNRHHTKDVAHLEEDSFEEVGKQEEEKEKASYQPGQSKDTEHFFKQASENQIFTDSFVMVPSGDIEELQHTYKDNTETLMAPTEAADECSLTLREEITKQFPNIVLEDNDNSIPKNATDDSFFFYGDGKNTWESGLETGAALHEAQIQAGTEYNLVQEFTDNQVWGNVENPNVVNGNSRVDGDSSKTLDQERKPEDVKKLSRNVVGKDLIHCEVEAESRSSEDGEQFRE